jgi:hypothetical protein
MPGQVSTERDVSRTDTLHVSRARGYKQPSRQEVFKLAEGHCWNAIALQFKGGCKQKPQGATTLLGPFPSKVTLINDDLRFSAYQ